MISLAVPVKNMIEIGSDNRFLYMGTAFINLMLTVSKSLDFIQRRLFMPFQGIKSHYVT